MTQLGEYRKFNVADIVAYINNINNAMSGDEDTVSDNTAEICTYIAGCQEISSDLAQRVLNMIETERLSDVSSYREFFLRYLIDVLEDIIVEKDIR